MIIASVLVYHVNGASLLDRISGNGGSTSSLNHVHSRTNDSAIEHAVPLYRNRFGIEHLLSPAIVDAPLGPICMLHLWSIAVIDSVEVWTKEVTLVVLFN